MQKELPLGITSFNKMRNDNYIYVDKTDTIAKLVGNIGPYFLSRPRRFGKSTLINTLDVLFSCGLEAFNDLKITQSVSCETLDEIKQRLKLTKTYKVLRLSFDDIDNLSPKEIEIKYIEILKKFFATLNIHIASNSTDISTIMDIGCEQLQEEIVLLIDEYDTPLTYYLDDSEKFKEIRAILSRFYKIVKRYDEIFRFIFITGITKYSNVSIFSAFNNLQDLSFNSKYGSIVGYTQEELEYYFKDYIQKAAVTLNEKEKTDIYTYEVIIQKLKEHYDGYCFDRDAGTHVYNPWSILNFLANSQEGFISYWLNSGGALPNLLVKSLNKLKNKADGGFKLLIDMDKDIELVNSDFDTKAVDINNADFNEYALFYQAGYLTIKNVEDDIFTVGVPNQEVRKAFAACIVSALTDTQENYSLRNLIIALKHALKKESYANALVEINNYLNMFSCESSRIFNEAMFRDTFSLLLIMIGIDVSKIHKENPTALGYSDLYFEAYDKAFICEFKLATSVSQVETKLKEAKEQLIAKKYDKLITNKNIVRLAIVAINTRQNKKEQDYFEIARIEEL